MIATQPMTRDEFYKKFPWVFTLPERPTCSECWQVSEIVVGNHWVCLNEHHLETCSRYGTKFTKLHQWKSEPPP